MRFVQFTLAKLYRVGRPRRALGNGTRRRSTPMSHKRPYSVPGIALFLAAGFVLLVACSYRAAGEPQSTPSSGDGCDARIELGDHALALARLDQAVQFLRLAYKRDQCARKGVDKVCNSYAGRQRELCLSSQRLRASLVDFDNLIKLSVILEMHGLEAVRTHDALAFRAAMLIMHHRPMYLKASDFSDSIYRDRRREILPIVDEARKIDSLL